MARGAFTLVLASLALLGCKRATPDAPPAPPTAAPALEITADAGVLYTYVDPKGAFTTTDKPADIPAEVRALVRVVDPAAKVDERRDTQHVNVVDVHQLLKTGRAKTKALPREAFETGALALLPPGMYSDVGAAHPPLGGGDTDAGVPGLKPGEVPVVTVYGTSWCPACKQAKTYLAGRAIPFADKDIERDPAAARELAEKAARLGIRSDRIPVLDVRGTLMVGFDPTRVETLLGKPL